MRTISLFSGIGGLDLGLERAGFLVEEMVEIDQHCQAVLRKNFPHSKIYGDIRTYHPSFSPFLLVGGFPCQDISWANTRAVGLSGERSGLWHEFHRVLEESQPRFVLIENVPAIYGKGLDQILAQITKSGYDAEWDCVSAQSVGAPHKRERFFLIAYPSRYRTKEEPWLCSGWEKPKLRSWWETEPNVSRVANGLSEKLDSYLRDYGNAVVPQVAEHLGNVIKHLHTTQIDTALL